MLTVEQAFQELMKTASGRDLAYLCYYDTNVLAACERFAGSDEWRVVTSQITRMGLTGRRALDLGAGNGIASYALAQQGFTVTAVEPDPSFLVGYGALLQMVERTALPITHVAAFGEALPFRDNSFSLVYLRQVLHHARDLQLMLAEISRVLLPGGMLVACREHVVDDEESLAAFLNSHPVHRYTNGENAFTLHDYLGAIRSVGLTTRAILGPWDSVINHYPTSNAQLRAEIAVAARSRMGRMSRFVTHIPGYEKRYRQERSTNDSTPGRMHTFIAVNSNC